MRLTNLLSILIRHHIVKSQFGPFQYTNTNINSDNICKC